MSGLPATWAHSELKEIADIGPKADVKDISESSLVHFVPMASVAENFGGIDLSQLRPLGEVRKGYTFFSEGDVLFAKITPCMENGKGALVPRLEHTYAFGSTEFHVLRPTQAVASDWLKHFLSQPSFRKVARQNMTGTAGQLRVPTKWLQTTLMPIPPRAEQTRIVAKLEELLTDLDAGVAELKAAQKKLAQYRQSLLEDVSQGTLLGDVHVEETTLGKIVISIGQGWSPKCENHPSESPEQWAVIKTTAIQPLSFDGSHNKELPANLSAREHLELQDGDLLVTRAGPRNRVGIACLVKSPRSRLILCDKAYRLKINGAKALPEFVELVLNSPRALQTIDTLKSGINDSGLNLTQDRFFTLPVNLPTIQDQQLLVNAFADANNEICDFESVIERSLSQAAAQRQNILRAAFAGELVPQDPNDEPASVLLERIRAERAAQTKPKARGRKKAAPEFEDPAFSG